MNGRACGQVGLSSLNEKNHVMNDDSLVAKASFTSLCEESLLRVEFSKSSRTGFIEVPDKTCWGPLKCLKNADLHRVRIDAGPFLRLPKNISRSYHTKNIEVIAISRLPRL